MMDDPSVQGEVLEETLADIELLNRAFGGYPPSLDGVAALIPGAVRSVRILDVGTGSADTPRRLVEWGRARDLCVHVTGIDLTETTVARARRLCSGYPEIQIELLDLYDCSPETPFDIVHAANVLHHFPGDEAVRALKRMFALARWGVVINDLHRHPLAWASAKLATTLFVKSPLVKHDAALSVRRAFKRSDLFEMCEAANLPPPSVRWRPMFRWQMVVSSSTSR